MHVKSRGVFERTLFYWTQEIRARASNSDSINIKIIIAITNTRPPFDLERALDSTDILMHVKPRCVSDRTLLYSGVCEKNARSPECCLRMKNPRPLNSMLQASAARVEFADASVFIATSKCVLNHSNIEPGGRGPLGAHRKR